METRGRPIATETLRPLLVGRTIQITATRLTSGQCLFLEASFPDKLVENAVVGCNTVVVPLPWFRGGQL
jgi:hypothetical protein